MVAGELAWVDTLLSRWGKWSIRQQSGALGYAKCSILMGAGAGEGVVDPEPPRDVTNEDFELISDTVMNLPLLLTSVVVVIYITGMGRSLRANAERVGVSKKMLSQYHVQAMRKIALDISRQESQNPLQSAT